jgi:hypothetical protein
MGTVDRRIQEGVSAMKMFHIVQVNDKTGSKVQMTAAPMEHGKCCTMLSKMIQWPKSFHLRNVLEEVSR